MTDSFPPAFAFGPGVLTAVASLSCDELARVAALVFDRPDLAGLDSNDQQDLVRGLVARACSTNELDAIIDAVATLRPARVSEFGAFSRNWRTCPDASLIGKRVGQYVLTEVHGSGPRGYSVAATRDDESRWRLKVLPCRAARSRLRVALEAARTLGDQRCCTAELVELDGTLVLAQPWVDSVRASRTLLHRNTAQTARLLLELLDVLNQLHSHGTSHGALHASNVRLVRGSAAELLLTDAGADRIGDERWMRGTTQSDEVFRAMAPEQRLGVRGDPRSDLYGLGWLILELVGSASPAGAFSPPPREPQLIEPWRGRGMEAILARLLEPDPSTRPASLAQVQPGLQAALGDLAGDAADLTDPIDALIDHLLAEPSDDEALESLLHHAHAASQIDRVAEALLRTADAGNSDDEASQLPDAVRARLVLRAGQLLVANAESALPLFERALRLQPHGPVAEQALSGIEHAATSLDCPERLVEALLANAEDAPTPEERARLYTWVGRVTSEGLDDDEEALVAYVAALVEDPAAEPPRHQVDELATTEESVREVMQRLLDALATARDANHRRALLFVTADWCESRTGRLDIATDCYRGILAEKPSDRAALRGLVGCLRAVTNPRWSELGTALLALAEQAERPEEAADAYCEAAEILRDKLGNPAAARDLFERATQVQPAHREASAALEALRAEAGDHAGVARLLERRLDFVDVEERRRILLRLATTHAGQLGNPQTALRCADRALELDGQALDALRVQARLLEATERFQELAQNLSRQIELADEPRETVALWAQLARVAEEQLSDVDLTVRSWERVAELEPKRTDALEALCRNLARQGQWEAVVETNGRLEALVNASSRPALLRDRGRVLEKELKDLGRAEAAYRSLLEHDADDTVAQEAIVRIAIASHRPRVALRHVSRLAELASSAQAAIPYRLQAGELLVQVGDDTAASEQFALVLDVDPGSRAAAQALETLLRKRGDLTGLAGHLERRRDAARRRMPENRELAAELSARLAWLAMSELGDTVRGEHAARQAIETAPDQPLARLVLAEASSRADRPVEAHRHLDVGLGRAATLGPELERSYRLRYLETLPTDSPKQVAQAADTLLKQPLPPEELERLLNFVAERGTPEIARRAAERMLSTHQKSLHPSQRTNAQLKLARAARATGDESTALTAVLAALAVDRSNEALEELAQILRQQEKWRDLLAVQEERLQKVNACPTERTEVSRVVELVGSMADVASDRLDEAARAEQYLRRGLDLCPAERGLLARMLKLYGNAGDWEKVVRVMLDLAAHVPEAETRAKYLVAAARVLDRELGRSHDAMTQYVAAMELSPQPEASAEAIQLGTALGDIDRVERLLELGEAHARTESPDALASALDESATWYWQRLRHADAAARLTEAHRSEPTEARAERLAQLYQESLDDFAEPARALEFQAIEQRGLDPERLRRLRRCHLVLRDLDSAQTVSQILVALDQASHEEELEAESARARTPSAPKHALRDAQWTKLVHPRVSRELTEVFAQLEPALIASRGRTLEDLGYLEHLEMDIADYPLPVAQYLHRAALALHIADPPVFASTRDRGGISFIHADPPALLLGRAALTADIQPHAGAFIAGRSLAYLRPGFYVRQLQPKGTGLRAWLVAAAKLTTPDAQVPAGLAGSVEEALWAIRTFLSVEERELLSRSVARLMSGVQQIDLHAWMSGVDLTADRAGLLVAGDPEAAALLVEAEDEDVAASPTFRRDELLRFAAGSVYCELRRALGLVGSSPVRAASSVVAQTPAA